MDEKQRQEVANFRYGLIAPLVTRTLNPGEQAAKLFSAEQFVSKTSHLRHSWWRQKIRYSPTLA